MQSPTIILVSGPLLVDNGKVLLVKEQKPTGVTPWIFPGGRFELTDKTLEDTARREAKEELGIDVTIGQVLSPVLVRGSGVLLVLVAYVATYTGTITPASDIVEYGWHGLETLPPDCAPNVYDFIQEYKKLAL